MWIELLIWWNGNVIDSWAVVTTELVYGQNHDITSGLSRQSLLLGLWLQDGSARVQDILGELSLHMSADSDFQLWKGSCEVDIGGGGSGRETMQARLLRHSHCPFTVRISGVARHFQTLHVGPCTPHNHSYRPGIVVTYIPNLPFLILSCTSLNLLQYQL